MKILLSNQVRELDAKTISSGIASGFELMERAGAGAAKISAKFIKDFYCKSKKIVILAGKGNNGGDGFVLARYLAEAGFETSVWLISEPESLKGDAALHFQKMSQNEKIRCEFRKKISPSDFSDFSIIIDALLGTGLLGSPQGKFAEWIDAANRSKKPIIALDLPSGLNSDNGDAYDPCILAVLTITFGAPKRGLFLSDAISKIGILKFVPIGIPQKFIDEYYSELNMLTTSEAEQLYPSHPHNCNKYSKGLVAVIAGSKKFSGAASLSASAAFASGAGFVRLLHPCGCEIRNIPNAVVKVPLPSDRGAFYPPSMNCEFFKVISKANALCVGPGMGNSEDISPIINFSWNCDKKVVFDADALNIIARRKLRRRSKPAILTPHEGEFARLLDGYSIKQDGKDRFTLAKELAFLTGNVVVLKGKASVIASPKGELYVNCSGSSALASAGTGDVLSGIIASFCAQGLEPFSAAILGVYIHGRLAEISGKFHLEADELLSILRESKQSKLFEE